MSEDYDLSKEFDVAAAAVAAVCGHVGCLDHIIGENTEMPEFSFIKSMVFSFEKAQLSKWNYEWNGRVNHIYLPSHTCVFFFYGKVVGLGVFDGISSIY